MKWMIDTITAAYVGLFLFAVTAIVVGFIMIG